jgi:hypothetical protein
MIADKRRLFLRILDTLTYALVVSICVDSLRTDGFTDGQIAGEIIWLSFLWQLARLAIELNRLRKSYPGQTDRQRMRIATRIRRDSNGSFGIKPVRTVAPAMVMAIAGGIMATQNTQAGLYIIALAISVVMHALRKAFRHEAQRVQAIYDTRHRSDAD